MTKNVGFGFNEGLCAQLYIGTASCFSHLNWFSKRNLNKELAEGGGFSLTLLSPSMLAGRAHTHSWLRS